MGLVTRTTKRKPAGLKPHEDLELADASGLGRGGVSIPSQEPTVRWECAPDASGLGRGGGH